MSQAIKRTFSLPQAGMASRALDLFSRIGIGQLDPVAELSRMSFAVKLQDGELQETSIADCIAVEGLMAAASRLLGYPSGASYGITSRMVPLPARRSWEIKKVVDRALAIERNPEPKTSFPRVGYDGLSFRITDDPKPVAEVRTDEAGERVLDLTVNAEQFKALVQATERFEQILSGDYQAVAEMAKEGLLLPFVFPDEELYNRGDKASADDQRPAYPSLSEQQVEVLESLMADAQRVLGFTSPVSLRQCKVPEHFTPLLELGDAIKNQREELGREAGYGR